MRDQTHFDLVAGLVAVLVVAAGAVAFLLPPPAAAPKGTVGVGPLGPTVYRNLAITFDPSTGGYSYNVADLAVPLGVRVIFTITNFDPASAGLPMATGANVVGTVGGTMNAISSSGAVAVAQLPAGEVSHGFSMSDSCYKVNAPIPRAPGLGTAITVAFSEDFSTPGTFAWGCAVLCGPSSPHMTVMMWNPDRFVALSSRGDR